MFRRTYEKLSVDEDTTHTLANQKVLPHYRHCELRVLPAPSASATDAKNILFSTLIRPTDEHPIG